MAWEEVECLGDVVQVVLCGWKPGDEGQSPVLAAMLDPGDGRKKEKRCRRRFRRARKGLG